MAKLAETAQTVIMVAFMVMNLEKILAGILSFLLRLLHWFSIAQDSVYLAKLKPIIQLTATDCPRASQLDSIEMGNKCYSASPNYQWSKFNGF